MLRKERDIQRLSIKQTIKEQVKRMCGMLRPPFFSNPLKNRKKGNLREKVETSPHTLIKGFSHLALAAKACTATAPRMLIVRIPLPHGGSGEKTSTIFKTINAFKATLPGRHIISERNPLIVCSAFYFGGPLPSQD